MAWNRVVPLAFLLAATGCDRDVGDLVVFVTRSSQVQEDPLDPSLVTTLRLRIEGPDLGVITEEVENVAGGESRLPPVPTGPDRVLTLEGLASPGGPVVSRGETLPFEVTAGRNELEVYVGLVDRFSSAAGTGALLQARVSHTATALGDGRVLVAGGAASTGGAIEASVEILDAVSAQIVEGGDCRGPDPLCLRAPRSGHAALPVDGGVLLVGGRDDAGPVGTVERCTDAGCGVRGDAAARWDAAVAVGGPGAGADGVDSEADGDGPDGADGEAGGAGADGVVAGVGGWIAGGVGVDGAVVTVKRVGPDGDLSPAPDLGTARDGAAAAVAGDGTLLVLGGAPSPAPIAEALAPGAAAFVPVEAQGVVARAHGRAARLPDGRVLWIGGRTATGAASDAVDLYEPDTGLLCPVGRLQRARWRHSATVLRDGTVLVAGGFTDAATATDEAEILDARFVPAGRGCQSLAGTLVSRPAARMAHRRAGHAATAEGNGSVLVTGGAGGDGEAVAAVEVFVPGR